jgi:hypothetical protein
MSQNEIAKRIDAFVEGVSAWKLSWEEKAAILTAEFSKATQDIVGWWTVVVVWISKAIERAEIKQVKTVPEATAKESLQQALEKLSLAKTAEEVEQASVDILDTGLISLNDFRKAVVDFKKLDQGYSYSFGMKMFAKMLRLSMKMRFKEVRVHGKEIMEYDGPILLMAEHFGFTDGVILLSELWIETKIRPVMLWAYNNKFLVDKVWTISVPWRVTPEIIKALYKKVTDELQRNWSVLFFPSGAIRKGPFEYVWWKRMAFEIPQLPETPSNTRYIGIRFSDEMWWGLFTHASGNGSYINFAKTFTKLW